MLWNEENLTQTIQGMYKDMILIRVNINSYYETFKPARKEMWHVGVFQYKSYVHIIKY